LLLVVSDTVFIVIIAAHLLPPSRDAASFFCPSSHARPTVSRCSLVYAVRASATKARRRCASSPLSLSQKLPSSSALQLLCDDEDADKDRRSSKTQYKEERKIKVVEIQSRIIIITKRKEKQTNTTTIKIMMKTRRKIKRQQKSNKQSK